MIECDDYGNYKLNDSYFISLGSLVYKAIEDYFRCGAESPEEMVRRVDKALIKLEAFYDFVENLSINVKEVNIIPKKED